MHTLLWTETVHHDGSPRYVTTGPHQLGSTVSVRLRAGLDAPIERIFLRTCPDGEQAWAEMHPAAQDEVCRWWEAALTLTMPHTDYRFLLHTNEGGYWLNAAGVQRHTPTDANDFKILARYYAPIWVRDSVFYQIFPDRFADGDPTNNVRNGEYLCYGKPVVARAWNEAPRRETGGREFFGGDLQGIAQRLDYLNDLGVNALYLTPIFTSPSSHKYDVADYRTVDPHFGGATALAALRSALDAHAMRLLLDIVPNHCGADHNWFRAAQADPNAPSAEFFTFRGHSDDYEAWLGVKSLPKLNYASERLREEMYGGADSILRTWMRPPYRIDGWRVDVANMLARQGPSQLGHKIGRGIRRAVKAEAPDAYLLGEHFFDGSPHLQGDELDATMNYQGFMLPLLRWLAGFDIAATAQRPWADTHPLPTDALAAQWRAFLAAIPWQIAMQQFNLLGSHDTPRINTALGGDAARVAVAATLLFTYPGVPSIYYGDEIGLAGGPDPDCRRCMPWDSAQWDHGLREHYRTLIALRRNSPALRWGGLQMLYAAGETIAYQREAPEERLIVVARRAADNLSALPLRHAALPDGTRLRELFSGTEAVVSGGVLPLPGLTAMGAQVWRTV